MEQYILYHLRWQLSAVIMMFPLWMISKYCDNKYVNLMIVQFIGALIFWEIDKWLFNVN